MLTPAQCTESQVTYTYWYINLAEKCIKFQFGFADYFFVVICLSIVLGNKSDQDIINHGPMKNVIIITYCMCSLLDRMTEFKKKQN